MLKLPRSLTSLPRWVRHNATTISSSQAHTPKPYETFPGKSLTVPYFLPRTHDIPVANIHFRSHHIRLLELFTHFATHAASALGIPTSQTIYLPTQRRLWTVIRSPFAHKKSQENFERKVHKRAIKAWDADPEVVEQWVKYLRVHSMGGVGMKVTRWEHLPLGVGRDRLRDVVLQLESTPEDQIKALGDKIVKEEMREP